MFVNSTVFLVAGLLDSKKEKRWRQEGDYEVNGSMGAAEDIPKKARLNSFKIVCWLFRTYRLLSCLLRGVEIK